MKKLSEKEIKQMEEEMKEEIGLYGFNVNLTPDGEISIYIEAMDAADDLREKYGKEYECIENELFMNFAACISNYEENVRKIKIGTV